MGTAGWVGGGGKNEAARASALSELVVAVCGRPLLVVLRSGILAQEESEGSVVAYLLAMYISCALISSSQSFQWSALAVLTASAKAVTASLCWAAEGWSGKVRKRWARVESRFLFFLSSVRSRDHHLLEWGQGFFRGTCREMVSWMVFVRRETL